MSFGHLPSAKSAICFASSKSVRQEPQPPAPRARPGRSHLSLGAGGSGGRHNLPSGHKQGDTRGPNTVLRLSSTWERAGREGTRAGKVSGGISKGCGERVDTARGAVERRGGLGRDRKKGGQERAPHQQPPTVRSAGT